MIDKHELSSIAVFEATYKSFPKNRIDTKYERVISTEYKGELRYFYIELFENNDLYNPIKKFLIAINKKMEIKALNIEILDNNKPDKYAEFKFDNDKIYYRKYQLLDKNEKKSSKKNNQSDSDKKLIEDNEIDMSDDYICIIDTMSFRNLLTPKFPQTGIKRYDGFFIITKNHDIKYKRSNCELYFDGEEEIEIGLGTFSCTKRRILYNLKDKLTMETFYNDFEDVLISITKILESPTSTNETITYEIIERTENVNQLPEIIIINESITDEAGLDKIKMGKHSYFDHKDNLIGVEKWIRNESYSSNNNYRIHTLYNNNEKTVMNIKLKQEISSLNKYSEIKIYEEFLPLIEKTGEAKLWFFNNKVYSHIFSGLVESRLSSYSSEGYYVFYPLAGLTDLIITKREFPLFTTVKSYSVGFHNINSRVLKPKVINQNLKYDCDEYIKVLGKEFYAMKLIIEDIYSINILWFDRYNLINLRWHIIDSKNKKILLKSELSEYNE